MQVRSHHITNHSDSIVSYRYHFQEVLNKQIDQAAYYGFAGHITVEAGDVSAKPKAIFGIIWSLRRPP